MKRNKCRVFIDGSRDIPLHGLRHSCAIEALTVLQTLEIFDFSLFSSCFLVGLKKSLNTFVSLRHLEHHQMADGTMDDRQHRGH